MTMNRFAGIAAGVAMLALMLSARSSEAAVISTCDTTIDPMFRTCSAGDLSEGWDGPGLGSYDFTYFIGNPHRADNGIPTGLTTGDVEAAFLAAANTWASVIDVTFSPVVGGFGDGDIDLYFHNGGGVAIPFDGAFDPSTGTGSVFAHAWGPPDVTFSPASGFSNPGNIHLDINESWVTSGAPNLVLPSLMTSIDVDLQTVILHELGHVLGLAHEDSLGRGLGAPVMQSFYNGPWRTLTQDDIDGARMLYAPAGSSNDMPEPTSTALLIVGLAALGHCRRRRR